MSLIDDFVARLGADGGSVRYDSAAGRLLIIELDGERFDPPVEVEVTDDSLGRAVEIDPEELEYLWPGHTHLSAGLNMIISRLDEEIRTAKSPAVRLVINEQGVQPAPWSQEVGAAPMPAVDEKNDQIMKGRVISPKSGHQFPESD
jgi:hypothetical protein